MRVCVCVGVHLFLFILPVVISSRISVNCCPGTSRRDRPTWLELLGVTLKVTRNRGPGEPEKEPRLGSPLRATSFRIGHQSARLGPVDELIGRGEDVWDVCVWERGVGGLDHPPGGFKGTGFTAHSVDLPHRPSSGQGPPQLFRQLTGEGRGRGGSKQWAELLSAHKGAELCQDWSTF